MTKPATPQEVDLGNAQPVTPARAPVGDPLSGREKAGVSLTWGVLTMISIFVTVMIVFLWTNESKSSDALIRVLGIRDSLTAVPALDTTRFRLVSAERASFRSFWLGLTQMILLNVLLPVLTALLGYVFGTAQTRGTTRSPA